MKSLIPGLQFALAHELTPQETKFYLACLQRPRRRISDLEQALGLGRTGVSNLLQRLKLKGLIRVEYGEKNVVSCSVVK